MTHSGGDGLGIGESPKDYKVSFGALRAAALAKSVQTFWKAGGGSFDYLCMVAEDALRQIGLDPNNAHKNDPAKAQT